MEVDAVETLSVGRAILWLVGLVPLIAVPLWVLIRRKDSIAEINVIWYAFSLVFVIWWFLQFAVALGIIELYSGPVPSSPSGGEIRIIKLPPPTAFTSRWFYENAHRYLTDTRAELGLVSSVIIIAIAPQFLTYVLSGLAGSASTPKLVWQFEKIAIWSLIKFLAALGGILVAEGLAVLDFVSEDPWRSILSDAED